jgi:hypothetical protein
MKNAKRIVISAFIAVALAGIISSSFIVSQNHDGEKEPTIESDFIESSGFRYAKIIRLGRIPLKDGIAVGRRAIILQNLADKEIKIKKPHASCPTCTTLATKTNIVPARGILEIEAQVVLLPADYNGRIIEIIVPLKNGKHIHFELHAKADFSTFVKEENIMHRNIFVGEKKTLNLKIESPNLDEKKGFISKVKTTSVFAKVGIVQEKNKKVKDYDDEIFWENTATIPVTLSLPSDAPTGHGSCELEVVLRDGETLKVPVSWNAVKKFVFEPHEEKFLLVALEADTPREFQIIYNADVGGKIEKVSANGENLEIVKTQTDGDTVYIKLRYTPSKNTNGGKVGELIIETKTGNKKLEILTDEPPLPETKRPAEQSAKQPTK